MILSLHNNERSETSPPQLLEGYRGKLLLYNVFSEMEQLMQSPVTMLVRLLVNKQ